MDINETNKQLYEIAFIQNGEYGYHDNAWKPSIDEREIETMCDNGDGHYVPATPLGYRDYSISRRHGLENIFNQYPCIDLTPDDKLHNIKRDDHTIRQYDKIKYEDNYFIVVGDDENQFYVVNEENKVYCVEYLKNNEVEEVVEA